MSDRDHGGVRVLGTDGGAADLGARLGELQSEDAELRARLAQAEADLAQAEAELAEIQDSAGGAPASPRVVARRIVALAQAEEAAREILSAADREASRRRAEATDEARRIVEAASREAAAQLAATREEIDRRIVEARAARETALVDLNAARVERDRALDALAGVRTALLRAAEGLPGSAVEDALAQSGLLGAAERAEAERAEAERAEAERAEAERAEAERAEAERAEAERAEAERAEAERAAAAAAAAAEAEAAEVARREAEEAAAREAEATETTEAAEEGPDSPDALFHFDDLLEGDVEPAAGDEAEGVAAEDTEHESDDEAVTPSDEVSSSSVRPISLVAVVDDDEAVADGSTEAAETAEDTGPEDAEAGEELSAEDHADATRTIIPVHERRSGSRRDPTVVTSAAPTEIVVPGGGGRDHTGGRTGPHRRQALALIGAILVVAAAASPIVISGVRDSSSKTTTLGPSQRHTNAGPAGTIKPGSSTSAKPTKNPAPVPGDTCDGSSGWQKKRVDHALTTLSYPWRKLGYKVNAAPAKEGVLATISTAGKEITAYVRGCADESSQQLAGVIAHQIGVAIDDVHGNSTLHKAYLRVRGLPSDTPWFPCATCDPTRSGVWDYAESFVTWQLGSPAAPMPLGPQPDANQLPRLTAMYPS